MPSTIKTGDRVRSLSGAGTGTVLTVGSRNKVYPFPLLTVRDDYNRVVTWWHVEKIGDAPPAKPAG